MLERLEDILIHRCQLVPNKPILVGVSGGPDSLCLIDILHRLGYQVISAHLNHKLRPESSNEAVQVSRMADILGVPSIQTEADVYEFSQERALSVEEAARELRYDFLFAIAAKERAQAVAVGHNADDQVETVLMHLIRGAGVAGLRGMSFRSLPNAWSQEIPLVRPLLGTWRDEVLGYCDDRDLIPIIDRSNFDKTYFRNRLRHDLIPSLEGYNPKIKEIILRTAEILSEDYKTISSVVDKAWEKCLYQQGNDYLALKMDYFQKQQLGVQRHLIRKAIAHLRPGLRDIDFEIIEQALSFIEKPTETSQRDLVAGLMLYIEGDVLWVYENEAKLPESGFPLLPGHAPIELSIPGKLDLGNGWVFIANIVKTSESLMDQILNNDDPFTAYLDRNLLISPLKIRSRLPGDSIQPLGMNGKTIKISEFMINMKMPRRIRDKWPLVCSEGTIIWLPGYRIHHANRITSNTKFVVCLKLISNEGKGVDLG